MGFIPKGVFDNNSALVLVMARCLKSIKQLPEPILTSLLIPYGISRLQWVNTIWSMYWKGPGILVIQHGWCWSPGKCSVSSCILPWLTWLPSMSTHPYQSHPSWWNPLREFSGLLASPNKHARMCWYWIRIEMMPTTSFQFRFIIGTFWHIFTGYVHRRCL